MAIVSAYFTNQGNLLFTQQEFEDYFINNPTDTVSEVWVDNTRYQLGVSGTTPIPTKEILHAENGDSYTLGVSGTSLILTPKGSSPILIGEQLPTPKDIHMSFTSQSSLGIRVSPSNSINALSYIHYPGALYGSQVPTKIVGTFSRAKEYTTGTLRLYDVANDIIILNKTFIFNGITTTDLPVFIDLGTPINVMNTNTTWEIQYQIYSTDGGNARGSMTFYSLGILFE